MVRVLYIFSGADRRKLELQVENGKWPDNWFYGYMQVKKIPGIEAEFIQMTKRGIRGNFWFFVKNIKSFYLADVIFLSSSFNFPLLTVKNFGLLRRQKWIILNLDLYTKLKHNPKFIRIVRLADKIISPSYWQNDYLKEAGIRDEVLEMVPLGIDMKFYQILSSENEGEILAVGRDLGRDYLTIVNALKTIKNKLVIVGRKRNIESLDPKILKQVELVEEKTPLETRDFYQRASVSVVPSLPEDKSFGSDCSGQTVILESMSYGRPVVASERSWMKSYFTNGRDLIIVPPESPSDLENAISEVLSNSELWNNLVQNGQKIIKEKCNSDLMGKRIAEIILDIA